MTRNCIDSRKFKILLVEDEPIVQKVHRLMLERMGYEVELAENGQQAIARCLNGYDIILMDLGLPDMSGIDATLKIRQIYKHVPIMAVTAYVQEKLHEECRRADFAEIIIKPVSSEVLQGLLQKILREYK